MLLRVTYYCVVEGSCGTKKRFLPDFLKFREHSHCFLSIVNEKQKTIKLSEQLPVCKELTMNAKLANRLNHRSRLSFASEVDLVIGRFQEEPSPAIVDA